MKKPSARWTQLGAVLLALRISSKILGNSPHPSSCTKTLWLWQCLPTAVGTKLLHWHHITSHYTQFALFILRNLGTSLYMVWFFPEACSAVLWLGFGKENKRIYVHKTHIWPLWSYFVYSRVSSIVKVISEKFKISAPILRQTPTGMWRWEF